MDLHVIAPLASPAERAAVDAVLDPEIGPARSRWFGAPRDASADGRAARGGHGARARRDLLLPALLAVQGRAGWISQPALGYICRRLTVPPAEAYGVATFYALLSLEERPPVVAHVCEDLACRLAGSEAICADLERTLGPENAPARNGTVAWRRSPCLGRCERAPAALYTVAGEEPEMVTAAPVDAALVIGALDAAAAGQQLAPVGVATAPTPERLAELRRSIPQAGSGDLLLLGRIGLADPRSLADYLARGGYRGLRRALELGPEAVVEEVTAAGLLGRGGAAFPTGRKWAAVAAAPARPHYTVCNADESEPGAFKDRALMEDDPFAVVEAMTIAGFATGSQRGYLYLRAEYPPCAERLANALTQAREAGYLGPDILGSGFAFDIELRRGAGAYVCGEETALFESIEGRRGEPRNKPPFPVDVGLFGKPTVVNNIETLVNVLPIVADGSAAFSRIGTAGSSGPKLFCLSGDVARPGLYEVPFGTTLRELLELAGGVRDEDPAHVPATAGTNDASGPGPLEVSIQAVLIGGAAGTFVGPESLDLPLTFEATREAGVSLGSGVVMVYGRNADLGEALRRIAAFFRDESCGQCVPCRVGTVRQEELVARVLAGRPNGSLEAELALFRDLAQAMRDASICGLGQLASIAIASAFEQFDVVPGRGAASDRPASPSGTPR